MFEFLTNYVLSALYFFKENQLALYFFAFSMAFLEALPVIGTFMPGTILLLLFGLFSAKGYASLGVMITLSVVGSVIGEIIAYYVGKYGRKFFKEHNRLLKLSHLHTGEVFFAKHGGKSLLFGRFIGPIRPVIAMVAGATQMPLQRFMYWNILGAIVWASIYITIGSIFANNIELIDKIVSEVSAVVLLLIALVLGIYFYRRKRAEIMKD